MSQFVMTKSGAYVNTEHVATVRDGECYNADGVRVATVSDFCETTGDVVPNPDPSIACWRYYRNGDAVEAHVLPVVAWTVNVWGASPIVPGERLNEDRDVFLIHINRPSGAVWIGWDVVCHTEAEATEWADEELRARDRSRQRVAGR